MAPYLLTIRRFCSRNGWNGFHLVGLLLLLSAGVWAGRDGLMDIVQIGWSDSEESHIFLAPLIAVWVVWVRRHRLRDLKPGGGWIGLAILAVGAVAYIIGDRHQVESFFHGGAVLMLIGCVVAVTGRQALIAFMPGFVVLLFSVPVPGILRLQISVPLETVNAQVTQIVMEMIGWTVHRTGNVLEVNGVRVAVAEACNGMRLVFALVLVSYAFAFSRPLYWPIQLVVMAMSPVLALLSNVIRLLGTTWAFGSVSEANAEFSHDLGGWLMLPLAFVALSGTVRLFKWAMIPVQRHFLLLVG